MTDRKTPCTVVHPELGPCIEKGPHGGADHPHRYKAVPVIPTDKRLLDAIRVFINERGS